MGENNCTAIEMINVSCLCIDVCLQMSLSAVILKSSLKIIHVRFFKE